MERGSIELGIIASNAVWPAWYGQRPYDRAYRNMRLVAYLYPNPVVFFALRSSGIDRIAQLKGKRVGVGPGPSTWDHLTGPFLEAHEIDYNRDVRRVYASFEDLATQVGDGLLDASIGTASAGILIPAIEQLASQKTLNFLEWDAAAIEKLAREIPYFSPALVPGTNLPAYTRQEYKTVDLGGPYLVARADLPDDLVYRIAEVLHTRLEAIAEGVSYLRAAAQRPALLVSRLGDVPFHPGAERYWRTRGLWGP